MKAGKMRHRIVLQKPEFKRGELGEMLPHYEDVAEVWADIRSVSAKDYISFGVANVVIDIRIFIRYRPDVQRGYRVVYKSTNYPGDAFFVKAVLPNQRMNMLELLCAGGGYRDQSD